ncbi:MAG: class I SAM-dependent methyltransferase [Bacteroides sp.]|nr:class I SAM-dependent methyltransferase [Bacteroides sp.]MCM1555833.1 class I SAM-dependent methyltransferase [Bacteroides sp.]
MKLFPALEKEYAHETLSAPEAQRLAQEIAFAPVVFQVSRLMVKFGILEYLSESKDGLSQEEIVGKTGLSPYAVQVLLEASLSIGTVKVSGQKYTISKAGWFLLNDPMVRVNMNFNHDVNYLGLFNLEESLLNGKPEGLKVFGAWKTIYEGLSSLPAEVQASWFGFDHYYSDASFDAALKIIFDSGKKVSSLLDVGGNTGRWAMKCVEHDADVQVTIMDLPQQIALMEKAAEGKPGADRIHGYGADLLNEKTAFPAQKFDIIWMSQFLDCFSEEQVTSILRCAARAMDENARLFIMETFWDRQRFETAAYCLTLTSVYFTALANGNSKMYHSDDMIRCVNAAGLEVEMMHDGLGKGHSILVCRKRF